MNKEKIRMYLNDNKGRRIKFKYNGARNQNEEFIGIIENTYNSIFTIKTEDNNTIKSFSYNDIINESLELFI